MEKPACTGGKDMNGKERCISEFARMMGSEVRKVGAKVEREATARASRWLQFSAACTVVYPHW